MFFSLIFEPKNKNWKVPRKKALSLFENKGNFKTLNVLSQILHGNTCRIILQCATLLIIFVLIHTLLRIESF